MTNEDLTYKLLTGEVVKNKLRTYYFSEPGNWVDGNGYPIIEKLHREDGPAVEYFDGTKYWYLNGKRHREDSPAVEHANGSKYWFLNGKLHREDGPAVEYANGIKEWWLNGRCHREDGPAVEQPDGTKLWWLNNTLLTEEEFNQQIKFNKQMKSK